MLNLKNDFSPTKNNIIFDQNININTSCIKPDELLLGYCNINVDNIIIIDYRYFKVIRKFNCIENDDVIEHMITIFEKVLETQENFTVYICLKTLTIGDIDKYYSTIGKISEIFKHKFPDKMQECFVYNAPFIFSQFIKIVSVFSDKKTMSKLKIVK